MVWPFCHFGGWSAITDVTILGGCLCFWSLSNVSLPEIIFCHFLSQFFVWTLPVSSTLSFTQAGAMIAAIGVDDHSHIWTEKAKRGSHVQQKNHSEKKWSHGTSQVAWPSNRYIMYIASVIWKKCQEAFHENSGFKKGLLHHVCLEVFQPIGNRRLHASSCSSRFVTS